MISSQENSNYLKFIFNEDLYLVNESLPETISKKNTQPENSSINQEIIPSQKFYKLGIVAKQQDIEKYKEFLTKLLSAIKIQWNEVSIISAPLPSLANYENFLVFGLENQQMVQFDSPIIPNEPLVQGRQKFIFTFSLSELDNNNARKGVLWGGLKKGFAL